MSHPPTDTTPNEGLAKKNFADSDPGNTLDDEPARPPAVAEDRPLGIRHRVIRLDPPGELADHFFIVAAGDISCRHL